MTVASIAHLAPIPADRSSTIPSGQTQADTAPKKVPFDPRPAIRPTIQDKIEINRALLALRKL